MKLALVTVTLTAMTSAAAAQEVPEEPPDEEEKEPGRGYFDAGGQVRLPNGPDEMGEYATFNWIAIDAKGRYFLLDTVTLNGSVPLAVKKPGTAMVGGAEVDPEVFGGVSLTLEALLPEMPMQKKDSKVGLTVTGAYMREGAMLLSEKDFPLYAGDLKPGFAGGVVAKTRVSSVLDVSLTPAWVYQDGSAEALTAVQIPMSLIVKLGEALKVQTDLGIYTGDDYTFRSSKNGRVALGGAVDVKIGPIVTHAGAGLASLGTGGMYPTVRDSFYIDLNVKYAK